MVLNFLLLNVDKLGQEVKNGIFCPDILPHVGNGIISFNDGISGTCVNAFPFATVKRHEKRGFTA